eukprot:gene3356-6646_t
MSTPIIKSELNTMHKIPQNDSHRKLNTSDRDEANNLILSRKQLNVFELLLRDHKSIFFTGAAGTGKSHILNLLLKIFRESKLLPTQIAFTAPTGVAACNIAGRTIHSWAGIGLGDDPVDKLLTQVLRNTSAKERWLTTKILIIDEISMISAELFDKLSVLGSKILKDNRPFGGIQLVVCGDFFQLPPVGLSTGQKFCFKSENWRQIFNEDNIVVLDKVFRQKDPIFLNMLHEIRSGYMSTSNSIILKKRLRYLHPTYNSNSNKNPATILPTKLLCTNKEVEKINRMELNKLPDEIHTYNSIDEHVIVSEENSSFFNNLKVPQELQLKINAQVMLLWNLDTANGLVNGTKGVVISFEEEDVDEVQGSSNSNSNSNQSSSLQPPSLPIPPSGILPDNDNDNRHRQYPHRTRTHTRTRTRSLFPVVEFNVRIGGDVTDTSKVVKIVKEQKWDRQIWIDGDKR